MIKYLGSKRRLVPVLGDLQRGRRGDGGLDLFTGTTRVAQEWKRRGAEVWAVDLAGYARSWPGATSRPTPRPSTSGRSSTTPSPSWPHLPGEDGYVTATFTRRPGISRSHNGRRIDAIRAEIERHFAGDRLRRPSCSRPCSRRPTGSTRPTGLQMAYLKQWSPRSHQDLVAAPAGPAGRRRPLPCGPTPPSVVATLPEVDLAYLDPPYNQHRYFTNYHVWETLVAWDAPAHYGVACKRLDAREPSTKSVFNDRRRAPDALARSSPTSGPGWWWCRPAARGGSTWTTWSTWRPVVVGSRCWPSTPSGYVGALIGIHNPQGGEGRPGDPTPATSST